VLSIEAKRVAERRWECYTENGRQKTGLDVVEWAVRAQAAGAGEILLTSVDRDGTRQGFETDLVRAVAEVVTIPVIASGGLGRPSHLLDAVRSGADAVAVASALHYGLTTLSELRAEAVAGGLKVR
jgi:cyclase